ncbi:MAG: hypothetical protein M1541_00440 [Acidobacteria bacterium]|nr:hypothetical protein [Acidobacteriota bacterium]
MTRRTLLAAPIAAGVTTGAQAVRETYATQAKGLRILPGQWRPHYRWEQIAWISPSWPCQDYLWLDFPEAIFTNQGLLYLSAVNPSFPTVFADLPKVPWCEIPNGLAYDRQLPNGVRFGGSIVKHGDSAVDLEIHIFNGTRAPLRDILLQTCAYLRGIREFGDFTRENKYVHLADQGWIPMSRALALEERAAPYRVGWRMDGKRMADLPVILTTSNQADRLAAMTWYTDTLSMISNPNHPCMHADPRFRDLAPGETGSVRGRILFFQGRPGDFDFAKHMAP